MTNWLAVHALNIFFPLLAFVVIVALGIWARSTFHKMLKHHNQKWMGSSFVIETMWHPCLHWFLILGAYIAIQISIMSQTAKRLSGEALGSLFVLSLIWTTINLSESLIRFYLGKTKTMQSLISVALNTVRVIVIVTGILVILEIWGAPMAPVIIVFIALFFIVGLSFRGTFDNLLAGLEIVYGEHIKVGHFIKVGSCEEGQVTRISWTRVTIMTSEGHLVVIPNNKIMANSIIDYGEIQVESTDNSARKSPAAVSLTGLIETLTDREREILTLIGFGATNREIAERLIISENTVKSHLRSILNKLNIRNRQQAAVYAEREGLVSASASVKTDQ